jgi:hypothetical protein
MSQSKFASITSSLLARKGEATPWQEPQKRLLSWGSETPQSNLERPPLTRSPPEQPLPASASSSQEPSKRPVADCPNVATPDKMKKCTVRVSHNDHDRLGILAVKSGTTRHHLLQEALTQFLADATQPYNEQCLCLGTTECATPAKSLGNVTA